MAKILENPANGYREILDGKTIAGATFFGPLYLLTKGLWQHSLVWLVAALFIISIGWPLLIFLFPIYGFLTPSLLETSYRRRGWRDVTEPVAVPPASRSEGLVVTQSVQEEAKQKPRIPATTEDVESEPVEPKFDRGLVIMMAIVISIPVLVALKPNKSGTVTTGSVSALDISQENLLEAALNDSGSPPSEAESRKEPMEFYRCKVEIDNASSNTGKSFSTVLDTSVLYTVRFFMTEGSVLASCSSYDNVMVVTRSPES